MLILHDSNVKDKKNCTNKQNVINYKDYTSVFQPGFHQWHARVRVFVALPLVSKY